MIKLFSVKQKQKEAAESANGRAPVKKQSAGELRVQKGMLSHLSPACSFNTNCVF
jgi:ubiquitin-conjugating enzyme E2 M